MPESSSPLVARLASWPHLSELTRLLVLFATGCWLFHPFMTGRQIGSGDALWYANMLADFVTQLRSGVFPIFVGQTDFAFNGAVYPLRVAPLYQHLAGMLDLLTGRQLGFFALQHATVILCGFTGIFTSYLTLSRLGPSQRWSACGLSVLFISCPGVLGTIYTQDLYMTWMTVPFLPVAVYGLVRTFQSDGWPAQFLLAAALAALWWGHSPVALWMTLIAGYVQLARLLTLHRNRYAWTRAFLGGWLFVLLGHYPFVSLASLNTPGMTSAVSTGLAKPELLTNTIMEVFPAVLLPLSDHARALSDLQLGYGFWLVFFVSLYASFRIPRWELRLLLGACLALMVLLLPVPILNDWLWAQLPEEIKRITFYWPMHRFYLIMAALLATVGQLVLVDWTSRSKMAGKMLGFLLLAAVCWSLVESRQFIFASQERTSSAEQSLRAMRPENRLLMNHAYGLFPSFPTYFSNGVMDPRAETHLLKPDTFQPIPAPTSDTIYQGKFRGTVDENPGVLKLSPALQINTGRQYALEFKFSQHTYVGILQFSGPNFFREYTLPNSGESRAFGTDPANAKSLPLWTTSLDPETITIRYIPTNGAKPSEFADFAHYRLREIDLLAAPVTVTSLLPFRAAVRSQITAWLETPRMFIPGYTATVDGQQVEVRRSPQGLVMLPVSSSSCEVEVHYTGTIGLRAAYSLSLAAWLGLLVLGPLAWSRHRLKLCQVSRPRSCR